MPMSFKRGVRLARVRATASAICATALLTASPAWAAYTITYEQIGSNVVATGAGTLNIAGVPTSANLGTFQGFVWPSLPELYVGSGVYQETFFGVTSGPNNLGSGAGTGATSYTGNFVGFFYRGSGDQTFTLLTPTGYVSGANLGTSTATFNNTTLAALGLNVGTYVYNLSYGGTSDTFTVQVGSGVPEPATWAMMLLGFGGIGFALRRHRKVLGNPEGAVIPNMTETTRIAMMAAIN